MSASPRYGFCNGGCFTLTPNRPRPRFSLVVAPSHPPTDALAAFDSLDACRALPD
jgi:hypothetical protein